MSISQVLQIKISQAKGCQVKLKSKRFANRISR
jgi:hypothetical protein